MQTHEVHGASPHLREAPDDKISLAHILGILRGYRSAILTILLAIVVAYTLFAVALYLLGPWKQVTTLPFRLMFEGADSGRYPNGMEFNSSEITATPVLQRVHQTQNLQRFIDFSDLKAAVFVAEHNKDLDRLALEYNSRLSDPKLTPVDRERLEKEYDLRKDSIRRTDYALMFVADRKTSKIPRPLRIQILKSILDTWAEQAMNEKGAGRYRIAVLSRNILQPITTLETQDYIVAIDILRTKTNRIIATIDQLLKVPGAEVLTTGTEKITLPEVRVNLDDTRRFRLEPMIAVIRLHHLSKNFQASVDFLQAQLDSARRRRDQERARVQTLQNSLELYLARTPAGTPSTEPARVGGAGQQVIPQVDKSFLDQLSELVAQKRDVEYRQRLVDTLNGVAIGELLPAENEVTYYETVVQSMKSPPPGGVASPATAQTVEAEYRKAYEEIYRAVNQVEAIYQTMSRNLNPGLVVYSLTEPAGHTSARSYSLGRLLVYGILLLVFAIPAVLFGALLHNRIREEELAEASKQQFATAD